MRLSLRKDGLTSLFKEVRVFKVCPLLCEQHNIICDWAILGLYRDWRDTLDLENGRRVTISRLQPRLLRSRPGKPNQMKGQNEKFMNFAHFL